MVIVPSEKEEEREVNFSKVVVQDLENIFEEQRDEGQVNITKVPNDWVRQIIIIIYFLTIVKTIQ